jgi:hypothetical protein
MSSRSQFKLNGEFVVGSDVADVVDSEDVTVFASEAVAVDNSVDATVVDSAAVEAVVTTVKKGLSVIGVVLDDSG